MSLYRELASLPDGTTGVFVLVNGTSTTFQVLRNDTWEVILFVGAGHHVIVRDGEGPDPWIELTATSKLPSGEKVIETLGFAERMVDVLRPDPPMPPPTREGSEVADVRWDQRKAELMATTTWHEGVLAVDGRVPAFQFEHGALHPAMPEILALLRARLSPIQVLAWFSRPDTWACGGRCPKDVLHSDPGAVIDAARHATGDWS